MTSVRQALVTCDGIRVMAEHLPAGTGASHPGTAVVLVHGFTLHSRHPMTRRVAGWLRTRAGVVALDMRGHGGSGGESSVGDSEIHDVQAAVQWARQLGYARVVTLGFSLGGACVLRHGAVYGGVDAVAAVSSPGRWYYRGTAPMRLLHLGVERRVGRAVLRYGKRTRVAAAPWVQPYPLTPAEAAAHIDVPLLLVHGTADAYFPLDHVEEIEAAAGGRAQVWVVQGYGHAEAELSEELSGRIADWLCAPGPVALASAAPPLAPAPGQPDPDRRGGTR